MMRNATKLRQTKAMRVGRDTQSICQICNDHPRAVPCLVVMPSLPPFPVKRYGATPTVPSVLKSPIPVSGCGALTWGVLACGVLAVRLLGLGVLTGNVLIGDVPACEPLACEVFACGVPQSMLTRDPPIPRSIKWRRTNC